MKKRILAMLLASTITFGAVGVVKAEEPTENKENISKENKEDLKPYFVYGSNRIVANSKSMDSITIIPRYKSSKVTTSELPDGLTFKTYYLFLTGDGSGYQGIAFDIEGSITVTDWKDGERERIFTIDVIETRADGNKTKTPVTITVKKEAPPKKPSVFDINEQDETIKILEPLDADIITITLYDGTTQKIHKTSNGKWVLSENKNNTAREFSIDNQKVLMVPVDKTKVLSSKKAIEITSTSTKTQETSEATIMKVTPPEPYKKPEIKDLNEGSLKFKIKPMKTTKSIKISFKDNSEIKLNKTENAIDWLSNKKQTLRLDKDGFFIIEIPRDKLKEGEKVKVTILNSGHEKESEAYEYEVKERVKLDKKVSRISGQNRIITSVYVSKSYYETSENLIIASAGNYPDAMSASPLAKLYNAPILLSSREVLDKEVVQEIERLKVKNVTIVGGSASVSSDIENQLKKLYGVKTVDRINGKDRYETSAKVADLIYKNSNIKTAVIASGENFADALAIAPFASEKGYPILLSRKNNLPDSILKVVEDNNTNKFYIAGGTASISKKLEGNLSNVIDRFSGRTRYETALDIAKKQFGDTQEAFVASGEIWPDALVLGPAGGKLGMPILLTSGLSVPASLTKYISESKIKQLTAAGGGSSVSDRVLNEIAKEIKENN